MEGIIRDRITSHLSSHRLISPSQHEFVYQKSFTKKLLECQHDVSGLDCRGCRGWLGAGYSLQRDIDKSKNGAITGQ